MTIFTVGALVNVQSRTWAGINKPGGVGAVCGVHCQDDGEDEKYDIKYVLGGQEKGVSLEFIGPYEDLASGKSSKRTRRGNSNGKGLDGVLKDSAKNVVSSNSSKVTKTVKSKKLKSAKKVFAKDVDKELPMKKKAEGDCSSTVHDELIGLTVVFPMPQSSDGAKAKASKRDTPSSRRPAKKKRDASVDDAQRRARETKKVPSKQASQISPREQKVGVVDKDEDMVENNIGGDTNMASVPSLKMAREGARPEHARVKRQISDDRTSTRKASVKGKQKRSRKVAADEAARQSPSSRKLTKGFDDGTSKEMPACVVNSKAINSVDQQEPKIQPIPISQEEKIEGSTNDERLCSFTALTNKARFGRDEIHIEELLKFVNRGDKQNDFSGVETLDFVKELQKQNKLMFCCDTRMIYFI